MKAAALEKPIDQHVKKSGLRNLCVQRIPPGQAALGIDANFGCGVALAFHGITAQSHFCKVVFVSAQVTAAAKCSKYALPFAGVLPAFDRERGSPIQGGSFDPI